MRGNGCGRSTAKDEKRGTCIESRPKSQDQFGAFSRASRIYRVFKLPESLLTAMREKRDEVETTNVRFLADAVDRHLPGLVEDLQVLGFGVHGGDQQMARLPVSDESATHHSLLNEAAATVGLPATKLVEL